MLAIAGPSGWKGAKAGPRNPKEPGSDQGLCPVRAAKPTNGGMAGSTAPCSLETIAPKLGLPPID